MVNLSSILQNAQGGQAIANLADDFGLSQESAGQAVSAVLPALSAALKAKMADSGALGSLLGALGDPQHLAAFQDPDAAEASGAQALDSIMGSDAAAQVAARAGAAAGLSPDVVQQMMPRIAAIALGGVMTAAKDQGLDGMLGRIGQQAQSLGLGSGLDPASGAADGGSPGGWAGALGGAMGSVSGAGAGAAPDSDADSDGGSSNADPAAAQNGLASLAGLFDHGAPSAPELEQEFGRLFGGS